MYSHLEFVLILLITGVLVVVVFHELRLPPILGYLLIGITIGPHALGWIPDTTETRYLAEFGVVFLMFSIGLEFSLPKLVTMKHLVFGLGSAQVSATVLIVMVMTWLLDIDWRAGLALGGAIAMSSTAIVSKILVEKLQLTSAHGRQIIGILLFQDLAVVPFLIIIPALAQQNDGNLDISITISVALLKAVVVLTLILLLGQRLMRPWFHLVARQKSSELFVLNVLLITLCLAWLTEISGLSLALGAFLAGMLISETEYRHQVEDDIKPFRDILLGLFFITIGMLLDIQSVVQNLLWVLMMLVALITLKATVIAALSLAFKADSAIATRTGLNLAQAGEFGFVLLAQAGTLGLIDNQIMQPVLAAMILSMMLAPFVIERSEHMARHFSAAEWMRRSLQLTTIATQTMTMPEKKHVILCGYGHSGQNISRLLEKESIPFIALDLDPQRIQEATTAGESVVYGDAARQEVLIAAGLMRAMVLIITYVDTPSSLKILNHIRLLRPELPVIVRTRDEQDIDLLKEAGATEVVAETMEGNLMLASYALTLLGLPLDQVLKRMAQSREERYSLLRGFFHGTSDENNEPEEPQLHSITITEGAAAIGKTLAELQIEKLSVEVMAVRRHNTRIPSPGKETRLEIADVLVLRGTIENIAAVEIQLLQG
jgi:monovalent cation:H+ antiporter-2, CPA2 family